ncbi:MAG TPA: DUF2062 domain-containing protein [Planctomycetota bacterium]|nr:DUF2062 domain-containing protein [Planctomycetota bacterium]
MLFLLKFTRWLYNSFAGAMTPTQLAYGLCLGFFMGMLPWAPAVLAAFIALILVTRASWGLMGITAAGVKPLMMAGGYDFAYRIGKTLLDDPARHDFWRRTLTLPVVGLVPFQRYVVLGGFVMAAVCAVVVFLPLRQFIVYFREKIQPRADQYRIVRWWRGFFLTKALSYIFVG